MFELEKCELICGGWSNGYIREGLISTLCIVLIIATTFISFSANASTSSGVKTIVANNVTTTIGTVTKAYGNVNYSSIFLQSSTPFIIKVWVYDTTKSKTLSDKKSIICTSTSKGHWILYKSGVTAGSGDQIRFYGSQSTSSKKTITYTIYGDKAVL